MQKYTYNGEPVALERWVWGVVYKDGTEAHQFTQDGAFHRVGEINQDNVALWVLYKPEDATKRIDIVLPEGAKIIHKYRRVKPAGHDTFITVYMFGYKHEGRYHYNFILPDDRIVQSVTDEVDLTRFKLV